MEVILCVADVSCVKGALQAFAGGILAYFMLEIGAEVAEYVERSAKRKTFGLFLRDAVFTTVVFAGVYLLLSWVERRAAARGMPQSLLTAFIAALAHGVRNAGEGFAIAGNLLSVAAADALLFTVGFAVHNATEGFGTAAPLLGDRRAPLRPQAARGSVSPGWPARFAGRRRVLPRRI
jgi:ZIP family zinc transporter